MRLGRPNKTSLVVWRRRHIGLFRQTLCLRAAPQPEEARSVPARAGDGPRDSREACIGRLAPDIAVWHDRDGVPRALVFAQEHGAGLEAPGAIRSRLAAPCEAVEMLCGLRIKSTPGLLLEVPAEKPRHEVLGEGRRRGGAERHAPQGAKRV